MVPPYFPGPRPATAIAGARLCTLVVDAEESFDWHSPVSGTAYTTIGMRNVRELHSILAAYGVVPAYLLTYPVMQDRDVVDILRHQHGRGECLLGLQLHTWVTPPFDAARGAEQSYAANLAPGLEEQKLLALKARFVDSFGFVPTVFRSGRYGLSPQTPALLEKHGFTVDTSLAPRTDFRAEGGPDYANFDCDPFWFGADRRLLEVPLCRSIVGWGGPASAAMYRALDRPWAQRSRLPALLTRSRCAERITLSPEGNNFAAMRRLTRGLLARGQSVLALSFHSSSLEIGGSPYVQSRADLHDFYDRLSEILDHLAGQGFAFHDVGRLPELLRETAPAIAA